MKICRIKRGARLTFDASKEMHRAKISLKHIKVIAYPRDVFKSSEWRSETDLASLHSGGSVDSDTPFALSTIQPYACLKSINRRAYIQQLEP